VDIYTEFFRISKKIAILPFIALINFYRYFISPLLPPRCRFYPTCSEYALESFKTHGIFKGLFLSSKRILKCHPFYHGEFYDPVPQQQNKVNNNETSSH